MASSWSWCVNNFTLEDIGLIKANAQQFAYLCYSREVGEEGTPHLQGYLVCPGTSKWGVNGIKKRLFDSVKHKVHLEPAKGNHTQNYQYCIGPWDGRDPRTGLPKHKDGPNLTFLEFGMRPRDGSWGGKREGSGRKVMDLSGVLKDIKAGATMKQIAEEYIEEYGAKHAAIEKLYKMFSPITPRTKVIALWLWGDSGAGKTTWCEKQALKMGYKPEQIFVKSASLRTFFDGLEKDHKVLIIEEFYDPVLGASIPITTLNMLLDKKYGHIYLDSKHGSVVCTAELIMFTAQKHPNSCFKVNKWDNKAQAYVSKSISDDFAGTLKRRLARVYQFRRTEEAEAKFQDCQQAKDMVVTIDWVPEPASNSLDAWEDPIGSSIAPRNQADIADGGDPNQDLTGVRTEVRLIPTDCNGQNPEDDAPDLVDVPLTIPDSKEDGKEEKEPSAYATRAHVEQKRATAGTVEPQPLTKGSRSLFDLIKSDSESPTATKKRVESEGERQMRLDRQRRFDEMLVRLDEYTKLCGSKPATSYNLQKIAMAHNDGQVLQYLLTHPNVTCVPDWKFI